MKMKHFFLFSALMLPVCLSAGNKSVTTTGDDHSSGNSWAEAYGTVQKGIWNASAGDTVFVAAGVYNQVFSISDGVHVFGGYDAASGLRDTELFPTILDGRDQNKWIVVKYDNDCTLPTVVDGLTLQNAEHTGEGGCAFVRGNCIINNCIIRNCVTSSSAGGVMLEGAATVSNCIVELCSAGSSGGAIRNKGGVVENCIIRGNQGKYAAVRNDAGTVVNCVVHNNSATVSGWPNSGGIYNPGGVVKNCIVANNRGEGYAGIHSEKQVINTICWGNVTEEGFTDPENFIASGSSSRYNACDHGFDEVSFSLVLSTGNLDAKGPHFAAPTSFAGIPADDAQTTAMRAADFRLTPQSPCIDAGTAADAPCADIRGVARPKGTAVDMGAYEYDPDAAVVPVTGVCFTADSITVYAGGTGNVSAIVMPGNATDKTLSWQSLNTAVATVANGTVSGVAEGTTKVVVTTNSGGFKDTIVVCVVPAPVVVVHPEVLAFDTLYPQAEYTVPSFIPFLAAKEAARRDSTAANLQAMRDAALTLTDYRMPYNVVCNINGDPATRMAFCWFTNQGVTDGEVQMVVGIAATEADFDHATRITATPTTTKPLRYAVSTSGILKATGMSPKDAFTYVSHKALAENLQPNTTYSYRVGKAGYWSDIRTFTTAKATPGEFKFLVMSDSHIMDQEYVDQARLCAEAAVANSADARFLLFPGDFVETGTAANSEWEWERWFDEAMAPVLRNMPLAPTDGNHDDSENLNYTYHFNTDNAFNKVAEVKPQFDGITYSFVYGDALFLVYSHQDYWRGSYSYSAGTSTYLTNDVANWFREQCNRYPETKWRIAVVHKNLFCGSGHQEDEDGALFRATLLPVFKELHIDFAIQGHDHTYEVIGPVDADTKTVVPGAVRDVQTVEVNTNTNMTGKSGGRFNVDDGTLYYVGATCGRKRYYPYTRAEMDANYDKTQVADYFDLFTSRFGQPGAPVYTEVTVNSDSIVAAAYVTDADGNATLFNSICIVSSGYHTGMDKTESQEGSLYPMPATDHVVAPADNIRQARAINGAGQMIHLPAQGNTVDVRALNSGMYVLRLSTDKGCQTFKMIKQ